MEHPVMLCSAVYLKVQHGFVGFLEALPGVNAPRLDGEDHSKDIDFTPAGISARRSAGYADTRRALEERPWESCKDALDGIIIHGSTHD